MVDNLRQYLEKEAILFPAEDDELYVQLISYIVLRTTQTGRPVFEVGGSAVDHAHDALILALLSITENYSDLHKAKFASNTETFSNTFFMPKSGSSEDGESENNSRFVSDRNSSLTKSKVGYNRGFSRKSGSSIKRKIF